MKSLVLPAAILLCCNISSIFTIQHPKVQIKEPLPFSKSKRCPFLEIFGRFLCCLVFFYLFSLLGDGKYCDALMVHSLDGCFSVLAQFLKYRVVRRERVQREMKDKERERVRDCGSSFLYIYFFMCCRSGALCWMKVKSLGNNLLPPHKSKN